MSDSSGSMRVLPHSKDEWFALLLLPFKAWVVVAWPAVEATRFFLHPETPLRWEFRVLSESLALTYLFCALVLLVGAAVQRRVWQQGHLWSLLYALAGFAVFVVHRG